MAPFWEQSPPIFRPLRSQNGAPAPAVCVHAAAAALLLPHKGPRGCPGSGGTVRKISSAVALVASKNRDFLPALAPASSQEPNPAAARHHRFLGSQKTARAPRGQYRERMSSSCDYCVRSAPSIRIADYSCRTHISNKSTCGGVGCGRGAIVKRK